MASAPPAKFYVQDRLRLQGALVADLLLRKNAYLYVCGDGMHMAKDVRSAITDILREHGGLTAEEAAARVAFWRTQAGTYMEDIWG